jgi:predicted aconitase with swiveling domain
MVQGAVLAGVALMDRLSPDPVAVIRTGDRVRVDPRAARVEVWPMAVHTTTNAR